MHTLASRSEQEKESLFDIANLYLACITKAKKRDRQKHRLRDNSKSEMKKRKITELKCHACISRDTKGPTFHIANAHIARVVKEEIKELHAETVTMLKMFNIA